MMKSLSPKTQAKLRQDLSECLASVARQHGIEIRLGDGSFTKTNFTMKLEGAVFDDNGTPLPRHRSAFTRHAHRFGLDPEWLGRVFLAWGGEWKVIGLNTRARKYPVILENCRTGKPHGITVQKCRQAAEGVPCQP